MGDLTGQVVKLKINPGIYSDETDLGAIGRWKDCDLIRFKNNLVESVGGWKKQDLTGATITGIPRSNHDWVTLAGVKYVAVGTEKRLYLMDTDYLVTNITPIRDSGALTDPFYTSTAGAYDPAEAGNKTFVSVRDLSHGTQVGDIVTFAGFSATVGGIGVIGDFEVMAVTDIDNYIIQGTTEASSTVSGGGGAGTYIYEITVGSGVGGIAQGWGVGPWGYETWGKARTGSTYTIELRTWSLDNWGEDLVASPRGGMIYVWDQSAGLGTRAELIAEAPVTNLRVIVSPENRQMIALGSHNGASADPLRIAWTDNEDYTEWTAASGNTAGGKRLDSGSEIVTGIPTRVGILIFTDTSVHIMQPTGGENVYSFRQVGSGISLAGPSAVADANGIVYFMGATNFYVYDGSLRVLPCPVWTRVYDNFNLAKAFSAFCSHNKNFNEVWWFYPSSGSAVNDRYVVYNYVENAWCFGVMDRASFHDFSPFVKLPYGFDSSGDFFTHEDGEDDDEVAMTSFIESGDLEIQDGDSLFHVSKLIPDFDRLTGNISVTMKGRKYPQGPQTTKGPYNANNSTAQMGVRTRARQLALRITQSGIGQSFRMGAWKARIHPDGER